MERNSALHNTNTAVAMFNIKLSLYKLIPVSLLALIRTVIANMTGNANFPTPKVSMANMNTMADALEAAITAATNGDRQSRILRDNLVLETRDMLRMVPQNVKATTGLGAGEIEFRWGSVHGAHFYEMWKAVLNAQGQIIWSSLGRTTRTRNLLSGLDSHELYAFRVNAIGVNGAGLMSATVEAVAA
ncbi:MAG: fibronectin type III domain-containing protein [Flavobacteriales bacterium]|nr:fibronectin type III domain-containing protein [Flavobacteriales bacterium]